MLNCCQSPIAKPNFPKSLNMQDAWGRAAAGMEVFVRSVAERFRTTALACDNFKLVPSSSICITTSPPGAKAKYDKSPVHKPPGNSLSPAKRPRDRGQDGGGPDAQEATWGCPRRRLPCRSTAPAVAGCRLVGCSVVSGRPLRSRAVAGVSQRVCVGLGPVLASRAQSQPAAAAAARGGVWFP